MVYRPTGYDRLTRKAQYYSAKQSFAGFKQVWTFALLDSTKKFHMGLWSSGYDGALTLELNFQKSGVDPRFEMEESTKLRVGPLFLRQ